MPKTSIFAISFSLVEPEMGPWQVKLKVEE